MYRYWDGQSWSEQTTSDPSTPPPGTGGPPPPAPPTEVAPSHYGGQDPYQQQHGQQPPYAQSQPGQYGGGGYAGGDPYGQQGYPGGPGGGAGKRIALIALAVVLIAGLAVGGFFGVRALADDDGEDKAGDTSQTEETEQTEDTGDTEAPTEESPTEESPTEGGPTGKECTGGVPAVGGETGRRGRIEGGDLALPPVSGYEPVEPQLLSVFTFADEVAATYQQIAEGWIAMYSVGALSKANGYAELEAAADQVITCMSESPNFYRNFTGRNDLDREEVEVDGHRAYSVTTEIRIDDPDIQVDGDVAKVIVVDTGDDEKFGLYVSVVPIGDQKLIDQQESATGKLKVSD